MNSLLDQIYCSYANRNPFFSEGWGDHALLRKFLKTDAKTIVRNRKLQPIEINWVYAERKELFNTVRLIGRFESPYHYSWKDRGQLKTRHLPDYCKTAEIEMWLPDTATSKLVIHFAATGDEGYSRRRLVAIPLLKDGVASVILENPYYGSRRDPERKDSQNPDVISMMQMCRATIDEGMELVRFFNEQGYTSIVTSGTSMGGYIASAVAASVDLEVGVGALIPSHSAASVYTEGALRDACNWSVLAKTNPVKEEHPLLLLRKLFDMSDLRHMRGVRNGKICAVIGAMADAYIPVYSCEIVHDFLKGSTLDWIRPGHVGAFFLGLGLLRRRIIEIFEKMNHT